MKRETKSETVRCIFDEMLRSTTHRSPMRLAALPALARGTERARGIIAIDVNFFVEPDQSHWLSASLPQDVEITRQALDEMAHASTLDFEAVIGVFARYLGGPARPCS